MLDDDEPADDVDFLNPADMKDNKMTLIKQIDMDGTVNNDHNPFSCSDDKEIITENDNDSVDKTRTQVEGRNEAECKKFPRRIGRMLDVEPDSRQVDEANVIDLAVQYLYHSNWSTIDLENVHWTALEEVWKGFLSNWKPCQESKWKPFRNVLFSEKSMLFDIIPSNFEHYAKVIEWKGMAGLDLIVAVIK